VGRSKRARIEIRVGPVEGDGIVESLSIAMAAGLSLDSLELRVGPWIRVSASSQPIASQRVANA
jgi:hypothetical protein